MPQVSRVGDLDQDENTVAVGSPDVFVDGIPVARVLDTMSDGSTIITGSPTVFANGFSLARVNDMTSENLKLITGSPNTEAGEGSITATINTTDQLSKNEVYKLLDGYNQPTTTRLQAAEQHNDDPGAAPIYQQYTQYAEQDAGLAAANPNPTVQQTGAPPGPPPSGPIPTDCTDIYATTSFPDSFRLSTNFTLGQVSTHTLVSDYHVQGQNGLTVQQIVCNLRALCINVLEPILAAYGSNLVINSGFRIGSGASQHYKGQAADISFLDAASAQASFNRAQTITTNFIYDQFIYEQNNSIWLHVSWNPGATPRRNVLSKPRGNTYFPGLIRI